MKKIVLLIIILFVLNSIVFAYSLHKIVKVQQIDDYTVVIEFNELTNQRYGNFITSMNCIIRPNSATQESDIKTTCEVKFIPISRIKHDGLGKNSVE